jgi:hypothetical protein
MVYVTLPRDVVPWDQPREWRVAWIGGMPMRVSMGMRTSWTYSKDGELDTFVPPVIRTRIGDEEPENRMYGRIAWKMRLILPGVA